MVVYGKSGFTSKAFEEIKKIVNVSLVYCNLLIDEIFVKRHNIEIDTHQNIYDHVKGWFTLIKVATPVNHGSGLLFEIQALTAVSTLQKFLSK